MFINVKKQIQELYFEAVLFLCVGVLHLLKGFYFNGNYDN